MTVDVSGRLARKSGVDWVLGFCSAATMLEVRGRKAE